MQHTCTACSAEVSPGSTNQNSVLRACEECGNLVLFVKGEGGLAPRAIPGAQEMSTLAPEGSIGDRLLGDLESNLSNLPVLPEVARRVMDMVGDPDTSMQALADVIEDDGVLSARILRVANSAMYGGLHRIDSIAGACARLGMRSVSNTVQAVAMTALTRSPLPALHERMRKTWLHSLVTAHCANDIALTVSEAKPETLYLQGLLHDLGKITIINLLGQSKDDVLKDVANREDLTDQVIRGFAPTVGFFVGREWELPDDIMLTGYFQSEPPDFLDDVSLRHAHIVSLANSIATIAGYGDTEDGMDESLLSHPAASYLNLSDIRIASLRVDFDEKIEALVSALEE